MSNLTSLATRHAGRPLLLAPQAAFELANRVRAVDTEASVRPGRLSALLRKLGGQDRRPMAMDDADDYTPAPLDARLAYAPLYAGEPDDFGFCWSLKDGVALMQVDKPLLDRGESFCGEVYHGYDTILQALREAQADDRVRGIFIRMATPGGIASSGLPALAEYMRQNGARAGGKPIHVYADMALSAGYWIASGADKIVAGRLGMVGSIGAVIVHESCAAWLEKNGIEITAIQFGAAKTDGAWFSALSDRAREDLQAEIDQCGRDFVADVVAGRPQLSPEAVMATQAAVYLGHHDDPARAALALNLIDAIASEEAAFLELRALVASGEPLSVPGQTAVAASARDRASASQAQEATVAKPKNAALAAAKQNLRQAQARVARLTAEDAQPAPGEEEEDQGIVSESDEDDIDTAPDALGDEDEADDVAATDEDDDQTEAEKIAGSAEAVANPRAANAAIAAGLTYAQFKKTSAAFGAGGHRLAATLNGAPRLGADGRSGRQASAATTDAASIYARRKARAAGGSK